jgi:hypothetical protein
MQEKIKLSVPPFRMFVATTIHTKFIANALPTHTLGFCFFYYLHKTIFVI